MTQGITLELCIHQGGKKRKWRYCEIYESNEMESIASKPQERTNQKTKQNKTKQAISQK